MNQPDPQSPRDWLLARHAHAQPQLDALRQAVVPSTVSASALEQKPASAPVAASGSAAGSELTLRELLASLFRPQRTLWRALAVAWVAMAAFHLLQSRPEPAPASRPSPEAVADWLRQLKTHEALAQINHDN